MKAPLSRSRGAGLARESVAFYRALNRLVRVYQLRDRARICYEDISVSQCHALGALLAGGPVRLDGLASELYLDKSTTSRVVDGLESKGYVRRDVDPDDGRAIRIEATPAGADLHARIERDLIREQARLLAGFSPDVRAAATKLIHEAAGRAERRFRSAADPHAPACAEPTRTRVPQSRVHRRSHPRSRP